MRVRFSGFLNILTIAFLLGPFSEARAQSFSGVVKNEKGFITITSAGYASTEALAEAWKLSLQQLLADNPGLQAGPFSGLVNLQIPVAPILKANTCDGCSAVYHRVQQSEGLFRIGRWYGNIPVNVLKERNNLRSDYLKPGQQLLIGYVEVPAISFAESPKPVADSPGVEPEVTPVVQQPTAESTGETVVTPVVKRELVYEGAGIFENEFDRKSATGVKKSGKAASFKSESGWKDGRFYILSSQLKPGVVVKLLNPRSGKSIFAKVVGPLPQIKQNEGLDWRLNNAASAAFGIWDENEVFEIEMEY